MEFSALSVRGWRPKITAILTVLFVVAGGVAPSSTVAVSADLSAPSSFKSNLGYVTDSASSAATPLHSSVMNASKARHRTQKKMGVQQAVAGTTTVGSAVQRLSGSNRFATSADISGASFEPGVPVVYIANGFDFPDALSGAPVAGANAGPVLLVEPGSIPSVIQAELKRLSPGRIVVLGGSGVVSEKLVKVLSSIPEPTPVLTTTVPTILGSASVGSTLTASPGRWGPAPVTLSYEWYSNGAPVSGATSSVFTIPLSHIGKKITVKVTGSKTGYLLAVKSSVSTAAVIGVITAGTPIISGSAEVGSTLSVSAGSWTPISVALSYQWLVDGVAVAGAIDANFTIRSVDAGATIAVKVTGSKSGYKSISETSAAATLASVRIAHVASTLSADTVWSTVEADIYVVDTPFSLPAGVQLTIEPGVIVKFDTGGFVEIAGTLEARGTRDLPIVLTSLRDDSVGGDTGRDGPTSGYMPEIRSSGQVTIEHAIVRTSGLSATGTVTLAYSQIEGFLQVQIPISRGDWTVPNPAIIYDTPVSIVSNTFSGSNRFGSYQPLISIESGSLITIKDNTTSGAIQVNDVIGNSRVPWGEQPSTPTVVSNNTVTCADESNPQTGIKIRTYWSGRSSGPSVNNPAPEIAGNLITACDQPFDITADRFDPSLVFDNISENNTSDIFYISGGLVGQLTTGTFGYPWVVGTNLKRDLSIREEGVLRLEPGDVVKFNPSNASGIIVEEGGLLIAKGTKEMPVTLTPFADDTAGGDLNGDGSASVPNVWSSAGYNIMGRITIDGGTATLDNTDVRWGLGIAISAGEMTWRGGSLAMIGGASMTSSEFLSHPYLQRGVAAILQTGGSTYVDADFTFVQPQLGGYDSSGAYGDRSILRVLAGNSFLAGTVANPTPDTRLVEACSWDQESCFVDTRGFDWGTPDGPFETSDPNDDPWVENVLPIRACGGVVVYPWIGSLPERPKNTWVAGSCEGYSYAPGAIPISSSSTYFSELSQLAQICASDTPGFRDACELIELRERCVAGALAIAQSQSTFPVLQDGEDVAELAATSAADYINSTSITPNQGAPGVAVFGLQLLSTLNSLAAVGDAYSGCRITR